MSTPIRRFRGRSNPPAYLCGDCRDAGTEFVYVLYEWDYCGVCGALIEWDHRTVYDTVAGHDACACGTPQCPDLIARLSAKLNATLEPE